MFVRICVGFSKMFKNAFYCFENISTEKVLFHIFNDVRITLMTVKTKGIAHVCDHHSGKIQNIQKRLGNKYC